VKFLLDTNAVIALMKGHAGLVARVRAYAPSDFGLPAIAAHELYFGAFRSQRQAENLLRVEGLRFALLDFDREDARCAAKVRAMLAEQGTPIGPYDVLIAGQALARGLILVSRNLREFQRVEQLVVENWEA